MSTKLKELKLSLKELKEKHDKLESVHDELITRYRALKEELTTLKANYDNLEIAYDLAINETHDATNHVAKLDVATSCDDLLVERTSKCVGCKGKKVVVAESLRTLSRSRKKMPTSRKSCKSKPSTTP